MSVVELVDFLSALSAIRRLYIETNAFLAKCQIYL